MTTPETGGYVEWKDQPPVSTEFLELIDIFAMNALARCQFPDHMPMWHSIRYWNNALTGYAAWARSSLVLERYRTAPVAIRITFSREATEHPLIPGSTALVLESRKSTAYIGNGLLMNSEGFPGVTDSQDIEQELTRVIKELQDCPAIVSFETLPPDTSRH